MNPHGCGGEFNGAWGDEAKTLPLPLPLTMPVTVNWVQRTMLLSTTAIYVSELNVNPNTNQPEPYT